MSLRREISWAPGWSITKSGIVRDSKGVQVPLYGHRGRFDMTGLAVFIGEYRFMIWKLLSQIWYDNALPLCRDGGLMRYEPEDVFVLKKLTTTVNGQHQTFDAEEVQYIWHLYQQQQVPCWNMAEKSGFLSYHTNQYRALIGDILIASIR